MSAKQKRQAERIQPFVVSCRLVVDGRRVPGFVTDLSTLGARVHCDSEPPPVDSPIVLEVRLGGAATHQRIPATVEWSRPAARGGFDFGLSFDGASSARGALESAVEDFRRRAAAIE
jgi:hypothetical protein